MDRSAPGCLRVCRVEVANRFATTGAAHTFIIMYTSKSMSTNALSLHEDECVLQLTALQVVRLDSGHGASRICE